MDNIANINQKSAQRWENAAKTLWVCALIIGIIHIVTTLVTIFAPEFTFLFSTLPGIIIYIAMWIQVSRMNDWLSTLNPNKDAIYTHLNRFRIGYKTPLVCMAMLLVAMLLMTVFSRFLGQATMIIEIVIYLGFIVGLVVGCIFLLMGAISLACSKSVDKNLSTGMTLLITSWGVNIASVVIYFVAAATEPNYNTLVTISQLISIISLANPILQIVAWRYISKTKYPHLEEAAQLQ